MLTDQELHAFELDAIFAAPGIDILCGLSFSDTGQRREEFLMRIAALQWTAQREASDVRSKKPRAPA